MIEDDPDAHLGWEIERLKAERDAIAAELADMTAAAELSQATVKTLTAELARASAERDVIAAERGIMLRWAAIAEKSEARVQALEAELDAAKRQPYLGIATNREIRTELACREAMGSTDPEYRTWEGERSDIDDTSKLALRPQSETACDASTNSQLGNDVREATERLAVHAKGLTGHEWCSISRALLRAAERLSPHPDTAEYSTSSKTPGDANCLHRRGRDNTLECAAIRLLAAISKLGEFEPVARVTYFESSPIKDVEAHRRWLELNDAGALVRRVLADRKASENESTAKIRDEHEA